MAIRLTHTDTLGLREVREIDGDLLLLPKQEATPYEEFHALRTGGMIPLDGSTIADAVLHTYSLQPEYDRCRQRGAEPSWMNEKPASVQKSLRLTYAITQEDPLSIVGEFPHTGLSYMVREGGFCEEVARACNLFRLHYIKQLGFLQAPWLRERLFDYAVSQHTRFLHSLDVMTIATMIGHNAGLGKRKLHTLRMAAFTHDMGTPAGGDSVKLVDMAAFDEDENYERLLKKHVVEPVLARYGIDRSELIETILNKGTLGKVLDIADKLAYTARDLRECRPFIEFIGKHEDEGGEGLRGLKRLVDQFPYICSVWDDVVIKDGAPAFRSPGRLLAFLKARVLMFRELYYNPYARFGEYLVSRVLVKKLYDEQRVTRDELLEMTDDSLRVRLDKEYDIQGVLESANAHPLCATFRDQEKAEAFLAELKASGNPFALLENNVRAIKPGTHFLMVTKGGVKPLTEAYPGDARELMEMANLAPAIHVYWLAGAESLPRELLTILSRTTRNAQT